jgi:exosortase D (VPLPA-CTERM-specific)
MLPASATAPAALADSRSSLLIWAVLAACIGALIFIFFDSLALMVRWWAREEYSHGYMIPFVAAFLVYQRINALPKASKAGSWWGPALLLLALALFVLGELSAIYTVIQYGFLLALIALVLATFGAGGTRLLGITLVYLVFMIPLPNFLYFNLSSQLQLISSQIGVAVIRLFDISVFLEGNVIDLGAMKLQVVEACSGLRYLFPLMSFGFLIACLYRAPLWQRAILFLSTMPITVLMNSFRIGVIGVTVDRWGIAMAEGFLHDFEGWIVFMGCVGILFLEAFVMHAMSRQPGSMLDRLQLDLPRVAVGWRDFAFDAKRQRPLLACAVLLLATSPWLLTLNEREEVAPARKTFAQFPLLQKEWVGQEGGLDRDVLDTLKLSDYIIADFRQSGADGAAVNLLPVNLYVAWYQSQKKGASIHSPRSCIPGGGWRMDDLAQRAIPRVQHVSGKPLVVNRAIIRKGESAQLVYYWFEGRGRNITNEYLAKWYIFQDSLLHSRSDGALVRVIAQVPPNGDVAAADAQLENFLSEFYSPLTRYIP